MTTEGTAVADRRRVLVTGSSGFIGTNLLERLLCTGTSVLGFDSAEPRNAAHRPHWLAGDIGSPRDVRAAIHGFAPTHVVHLAARTDLDGTSMADYEVNVDGLGVVLGEVTRAGTIVRSVFASTRLVVDYGFDPICDYDYVPPNCYARSKAIGEQMVRAADPPRGWVIVRPTSIWGPYGRQPYRDFFLAVVRRRYIQPGRSRAWKHYGYVENTAHQIDRLLTAPEERVNKRTLYLADPSPVEVSEMADAIARAAGVTPPRRVPYALLKVPAVLGDAALKAGVGRVPLSSPRLDHLRSDMLFDVSQIDDITGPLPFTMEDGIRRTLAHLADAGDL
jgi:nucleoside-diphosphate-sugar epimerase